MPSHDLSDITLVTIGFNSAEVLGNHYSSLRYEALSVEHRPAVLFIDNDSSDDSLSLLRQDFPWVRAYKNAENIGYGAAANVGIKQAKTRYILVLNPDLMLCQKGILGLQSCLEKNDKAAVAGPDVSGSDRSDTRKVEWIIGAAMMFDTHKMGSIGYFDENYFLYFEETDLCYRILEEGKEVLLCHNSKLLHIGGASSSKDANRELFLSYHWGKSYRIIAEKFPHRVKPVSKRVRRMRKSILIASLCKNHGRKHRAKAKILGLQGKGNPYSLMRKEVKYLASGEEKTYWVISCCGNSLQLKLQTFWALSTLIYNKSSNSNFILATDQSAEEFASFKEQVDILALSETQMAEWTDDFSFFYKFKPNLLKYLAENLEGNFVWVDSDTVCIAPLEQMEKRLADGICYMHKQEYLVSKRRSKEQREYDDKLSEENLAGYNYNEETWMWNAGIVGIPKLLTPKIREALDILNAMESLNLSHRTRLREQLAFSIFCQSQYPLKQANQYFLHYWGNKEEWFNFSVLKLLKKNAEQLSSTQSVKDFIHSSHPDLVSPKKSKSEKRKMKIRKLLGL